MIKFSPNLANYLTLSRLVLIPFFVLAMYFDKNYLAVGIFVVASLTDFLDGYIARKRQQITDFGKLMDPIADKILVMAALVMLVGQRGFLNADPWVPAWMVVMILTREIWVSGVRSIAANNGIVIPAGHAGKVKSFFQMLAIVLLLLNDLLLFKVSGYYIDAQFIGERLLLISIIFSYWGAVEYTSQVFNSKLGSKNSHS